MRRRLSILVPLVLVLVIAAACGGGKSEHSIEGVIIDVQSTSLTTVDSFTLHTSDGKTLLFHVAPDAHPDPREGFVAGHLRSHAVAAEPVKVYYREENGQLLATRLTHPNQ